MTTRSITPDFIACPRCRSHDVARSRTRSFLERVARFLGVRPFRCMDCYERFFSFGARVRREQPSHPDAHRDGPGPREAKVQS